MLLVAALPACALTGRTEEPAEWAARERAFAVGASALKEADFGAAVRHLATVAAICPVDGSGRRAMLMLAAAELDPRNRARRPNVAAELAAFQLARPHEEDAWVAPLAAELYVLALDYGADSIPRGRVPGALVLWSRYFDEGEAGTEGTPVTSEAPLGVAPGGAHPAVAVPRSGGPLCDVPDADLDLVLPELTRAPARVRAGANGRPAAPAGGGAEDVRALMAEVDRLRAELAAKDQELDRIRRTLRP